MNFDKIEILNKKINKTILATISLLLFYFFILLILFFIIRWFSITSITTIEVFNKTVTYFFYIMRFPLLFWFFLFIVYIFTLLSVKKSLTQGNFEVYNKLKFAIVLSFFFAFILGLYINISSLNILASQIRYFEYISDEKNLVPPPIKESSASKIHQNIRRRNGIFFIIFAIFLIFFIYLQNIYQIPMGFTIPYNMIMIILLLLSFNSLSKKLKHENLQVSVSLCRTAIIISLILGNIFAFVFIFITLSGIRSLYMLKTAEVINDRINSVDEHEVYSSENNSLSNISKKVIISIDHEKPELDNTLDDYTSDKVENDTNNNKDKSISNQVTKTTTGVGDNFKDLDYDDIMGDLEMPDFDDLK